MSKPVEDLPIADIGNALIQMAQDNGCGPTGLILLVYYHDHNAISATTNIGDVMQYVGLLGRIINETVSGNCLFKVHDFPMGELN